MLRLASNQPATPGNGAPTLRAALLVSEVNGRTLVTHHKIRDGQMRAGSLLDDRALEGLLISIRDGRPSGGRLIPSENVLFHDGESVAWIKRGTRRPMHFAVGARQWSWTVPWPDLVIFTFRGQTSVAALNSRNRDPNQPVFHAPLMNVYSDCRVCQPRGTDIEISLAGIPSAEDMLFNTAFSHANHQVPVADIDHDTTATDDLVAYYKALTKRKKHPVERFSPLGMTLQQWLSSR